MRILMNAKTISVIMEHAMIRLMDITVSVITDIQDQYVVRVRDIMFFALANYIMRFSHTIPVQYSSQIEGKTLHLSCVLHAYKDVYWAR